jgi:glucosamine--fructose-6-phosphate aminotransferase (isomerizing)
MVNDAGSPAATHADLCLPLLAGPEVSVAATKSFVVSLAAGAALVAEMAGDPVLRRAVHALPETLARAIAIDWLSLTEALRAASSIYVLGRGPSLPIAAETALKLKETCAIHAEAYSLAEVMHGPLEIVAAGFPALVYLPEDAARATSLEGVARLRAAGAICSCIGGGGLAYAATGAPLLDPISMIATAYVAIESLARARGRDPDRPHLLKKVTETV